MLAAQRLKVRLRPFWQAIDSLQKQIEELKGPVVPFL